MNYQYNKLRGRIVEKFGSQAEFAKALGVSTTTMSEKMTCKTAFSQKDIEKWAAMLEIEKSEYSAYFFA